MEKKTDISRPEPIISKTKNLYLISPESLPGLAMLGYLFLVFAIIYILPDNILDISFTLSKFVQDMALIFPGVTAVGKYSQFPQVAQLVYSLCIVTLPVAVIPMYKIGRNEFNSDMTKRPKNIPAALLFLLICCICITLMIIYWIGGPGGRSLTREMYKEKWAFAIVISFIFEGFIFLVSLLIATINLSIYKSDINNANKYNRNS